MNGDSKTANKYVPILNKALVYLYEHDSLAILHPLLSHSDFNVRQYAAYALLPLFEDESRKVLSEIANGDSRIYEIQSLNAEMTLIWWDIGELHFPYQPEYWKKPSEEADKKFFEAFLKNKDHTTLEKKEAERAPTSLSLRISKLFECPLEGNYEEIAEKIGVYIDYDTDTHELVFRINTFVNPYTQDVESVYQKRLERFKIFELIASISADKPSKFGFMQIVLTIHEDKATDDVILQIKDAVDWNNGEWKPNECKVCCKAEYKGAECYFEGSWWYVWRAVIKNRKGYERYDFSDESKFDEDMWNLESGEYTDLENTDSFCLISPSDFESVWDKTTRIHKPVP